MTISASDLAALRTGHPHIAKLNMSVLQPTVVYCGTVSGSPAYGARAITVANVSGDIANIEAGMTMFVGTSCGDKSISKRRIRSVAGQILNLDENTVTWVAGQYVTVMYNWELWSIFPYINPTTYVFYKDYDIAYSDQNLYPSPVAIAGPHRAKFLDGYSVSFDLDASDSYAVASGATIASYLWQCTGGSIANASASSTTLSFTNPGQYWLKLTVTDSNGKSQSTRRVVFVHQRTGTYAPYYDWSFESSPSGEWQSGGWTASIKVTGNASQTEFPDGTLVVIWYETYFNGVERYINNDNLVLVGYIAGETIQKNMDVGQVVFQVETINALLDKTAMRSVTLVHDNTPSTWYEMANLTMRRAVHHLWKWHSTLLDICDVYMDEDGDLIYAVDDFTNGTLYKQVDNFTYQHGNFSHVCSNKKGVLYLEKDINTLTTSERAARGIDWTLANEDRKGPTDLEIVREPHNRTSYVIVSGTSYDGSTTTPLIAQAPGEIPYNFGQSEVTFERLVLDNQAQANHYAGRVLAIANRELAEIRIPLTGNYLGAVDIVPQQWLYLSLLASDNKRGSAISTKIIPRNISTEINMQAGTIFVNIVTEPEAIGPDGIAADIPTVEPPDAPEDYPMPPIPEMPPWPEIPPLGTCTTDNNAPSNGPYITAINATITCIDPIPYVLATLPSYIRRSAATFKTIVLIDGCKYISTNGGASWAPWTGGTEGLIISAYDLVTGPKAPVATNYPVVASDVDGCSWRGGEFSPVAAVATDAYMVKLVPEKQYFNGLTYAGMVYSTIGTELIDDMRIHADGAPFDWPYQASVYAIFKLTFSSLPAFVNVGAGYLKITYKVVHLGQEALGDTGTITTYIVDDYFGENLDAYKVPAPVGLSVGDSTPDAPIGGYGYIVQARGGPGQNIGIGDNYMGVIFSAGPNNQLPRDGEWQFLNVYWWDGMTDQLLMTSNLTRIDVTNIRVYNVCFA